MAQLGSADLSGKLLLAWEDIDIGKASLLEKGYPMTGLVVLLVVECIICFLYTLNLFLRGQMKPVIEAVLGLLIFVVAIVSFFVLGWKWGLGFIVLPFILIGMSRPFAQALAYRMLGYRTGVDDDSGMDFIREISKGEKGFQNAMAKLEKEDVRNRARLQKLYDSSNINFVLSKHGYSFEMYRDALRKLKGSALTDLAWEIVSSPDELNEYIQLLTDGKSEMEIWSHFRKMK
jgi:hypothetical protein